MNLQKISNSAFRIIDLCHQIASGEYSEKGEARCIVAKAGFAEDEVVAVRKLGDIE